MLTGGYGCVIMLVHHVSVILRVLRGFMFTAVYQLLAGYMVHYY